MNERLGQVVTGSLLQGIEVKLDSADAVEQMAVGRYVTIQGKTSRFFGMITDISLGVTDAELTYNPPASTNSLMNEILSGTSTYGLLHVLPLLTISGDVDALIAGPEPVKTVPSHFSPVSLATDEDIRLVFGSEEDGYFHIGNPLDMETKLCLDLQNFVKRSNGIFGKSGTGKTYFTRILLIGMLQKSKAVNLIFDMHNEYGWQGTSEGAGHKVKGLKQLFENKVAVCTLDEENSKKRNVKVDFAVKIGYDEIEPADLVLLKETLNLTDLAVEAAYAMRRHFGKNWMASAVALNDAEEIKNVLESTGVHESTFQNLQRGLATIRRLPFMEEKPVKRAVPQVLGYLDSGKHVVLEFGRHRDITTYILVANLLTRRIYARYQEKTEKAMAEDTAAPTPLAITIEEAHKFLNSQVASQTIFGTIAREMRKYNVTLLVIDQRPSGIDEEVMSQMGTKVTFLLDNERDIDSVLEGVSGKSGLKSVLSRLSARRQALIFGHAVPMPVTFEPREYGSAESYQKFGFIDQAEKDRKTAGDIEELWQ